MNTLRQYLSSPIICNYITDSSREELVINDAFARTLSVAGLSCFDAIWDYSGGEIIKKKNNRSVQRITLPHSPPLEGDKNDRDGQDASRPTSFFLKRHFEPIGLPDRISLPGQPAKRRGEGLKEFLTYCDFRDNGLATATPVAGGMQRTGRSLRSFLITMDFTPLYSLEDIILQQPDSLQLPINQEKRKILLAAIAGYAHRMHQSGMNQKDFNATHILVDDIESPAPTIALFDLQHVDRKRINRFRWPVKALAELNVSLPGSIFSEQDRSYLFRCYKNRSRLDLLDKIQYNWIVKKTKRIRKHTLKHNLAPKSDSLFKELH